MASQASRAMGGLKEIGDPPGPPVLGEKMVLKG